MSQHQYATLLFFVISSPPTSAVSAFDSYSSGVETRLNQQPIAVQDFDLQLRKGEPVIERLTPPVGAAFDGASLHHWRGTVCVPSAKAADFERLLRDIAGYPRYFAPQVIQARLSTQTGDRMQVEMRVRQQYVITVVMDTDYDVTFRRVNAQRGFSVSKSTRIVEVDSPEDHGFLWRLNTYWSYEERNEGLYLQIQAVSLSRRVPRGLGWAIQPYADSIPRESLEFTLRSVCKVLLEKGLQK
jgi:hypothetical protein